MAVRLPEESLSVQAIEDFVSDMDRLARSVGDDLTEPLEACKAPIAAGIGRHFDSRSSPDGSAWAPRAYDAPHPLLEETGALRGAATGSGPGHVERIENGNELVWGVDKGGGGGGIPGAAVHQFGATIVPVEKQFLRFQIGEEVVFAKEVTIPARPYLGIGEETAVQCDSVFGDWLQEQAAEEVA